MKTVQREGPFHLVGMCSGAFVGFEMAKRLEAAGETVAFLGIVDTWANNTRSKLIYVRRITTKLSYYQRRLRALFRLQSREQFATLQSTADRRITRLKQNVMKMFGRNKQAVLAVSPSKQQLQDVGEVTKPLPVSKYGGRITVFRIPKQPFWRIRDFQLGWANYAETVRVVQWPGSHHHKILLEPQVKYLGQELQACLDTTTDLDPSIRSLTL